jgi:hypothetical protein
MIAASAAHRGDQVMIGKATERAADAFAAMREHMAAAIRFAAASVAYQRVDLWPAAVRTGRRAAQHYSAAGDLARAADVIAATDLAATAAVREDPHTLLECALLAGAGARILQKQGRMDAAVLQIAAAVAMLHAAGEVHGAQMAAVTQGEMLIHAGRAAEAESPLRWVIDAGPSDATRPAAIWLAKALWELGRRKESKDLGREYKLR